MELKDMEKFLEEDVKYIDYEANIENICEEYIESNLLFYETGNRMAGPRWIFVAI